MPRQATNSRPDLKTTTIDDAAALPDGSGTGVDEELEPEGPVTASAVRSIVEDALKPREVPDARAAPVAQAAYVDDDSLANPEYAARVAGQIQDDMVADLFTMTPDMDDDLRKDLARKLRGEVMQIRTAAELKKLHGDKIHEVMIKSLISDAISEGKYLPPKARALALERAGIAAAPAAGGNKHAKLDPRLQREIKAFEARGRKFTDAQIAAVQADYEAGNYDG